MNVVKKDLTVEPFNDQKIVDAVNKSASRVAFIREHMTILVK